MMRLPRRPIFVLLCFSLAAIALLSLDPSFDQPFFVTVVEVAQQGAGQAS